MGGTARWTARWWVQATGYGPVTVVTSPRGVRAIRLPGDPAPPAGRPDDPDPSVSARLDDWLVCRVHQLDLRLDLDGVEGFRRRVLDTLAREVGWGETVSYGELAAMAGRPGAARAVGNVMASNPLPLAIPCHRVVASGGRIGGYGGGRDAVALKRALLAREGVAL